MPLKGLKLIKRNTISDHRGYFSRFFCSEEFKEFGWKGFIAQINHTLTVEKGSIRGMHFQLAPFSETKIVSCLRGEIWDVAVDLRKDSPTFLRWHAEILSSENSSSILIPQGFAHGFQTLSENCELIYLHSAPYAPNYESGLRFNDPALNIKWPLPVTEYSNRDISHNLINTNFKGI